MKELECKKERIQRAEVVEVVKVIEVAGEGTDDSPIRLVEQYWGKNGRFIGKIDAIQPRK